MLVYKQRFAIEHVFETAAASNFSPNFDNRKLNIRWAETRGGARLETIKPPDALRCASQPAPRRLF
jgi:hypothetical protein